jgi:DNA-binding GntR family transcriptional regulator
MEFNHEESLSEKAYRILKEGIITCELLPGNRLSQSHLSRRLEIGMTPIRDALQRLALEGFVEAVPRHGYIVTPVDVTYVAEIFEMRQIMEQSAVRLAMERASDKDLIYIREMADFEYVFKERETYLKFLERNAGFHLAIAELTGNSRLVNMLDKLLIEMTRLFHLGLDLRDSANEMRLEHIHLADTLLERNIQQAVNLLRHQIDASQARIVEALNKVLWSGKISLVRGALRADSMSKQDE